MDNSFDFDKYIGSLNDQAPKQAPLPKNSSLPQQQGNPLGSLPTDPVHQADNNSPEPVAQAPIVEPPSAAETYLQKLAKESANEPAPLKSVEQGSYPFNALPESPLSLIDRAHLGWARTPTNQKELLEHNFGKDNVQLVHNDKEAGYVVKDSDGKWKQVDPSMSWHIKDMGRNIMNLPGDAAQFAGEYGLRSTAAAAGAAQGIAMGAPGGPIGMAAGGLVGAMAGSGGAELADMATRKAMPDDFIGSNVTPHNFEDLSKQLYSSMLFGAQQEVGGKMLTFGGKASMDALAGAIKSMSDTPAGRALAAKVVGTVSGLGESLARVRVDNPFKVAAYDHIASQDLVNRTNKLGDLQEAGIQQAYDGFQEAKKKIFGPQYAAVKEIAGKLDYNPTEAAGTAVEDLTNSGYLVKGKVPNPNKDPGITRDIGASEANVINYVNKSAGKIAQRESTGKPVTSDEMQSMINTMDAKLYESEAVSDPRLRGIFSQFRANLKNHYMDALKEADPEAALKYSELDTKYAPVKELMEELAPLKSEQKVAAFVKKIVKDDGSYNSTLVSKLSDLLGSEDPTERMLQMHVAQKSTSWTSGKKLGGVIPGSPALMAKAVSGFSDAKQGITQPMSQAAQAAKDSVPYIGEAFQFIKQLGFSSRKQLFSNPQAIDALSSIVAGGVKGEQQSKKQLLDHAGVSQ